MALYPDIVRKLLEACAQYKSRAIDLATLQSELWTGVQTIVGYDEKELRSLLKRTEAELELIRFTVNSAEVFEKTLFLVQAVEKALQENLQH